jgi:hypothetical protein
MAATSACACAQERNHAAPGMNSLLQQARFDAFLEAFNDERPHEALARQTPAARYPRSLKTYQGLPELTYPLARSRCLGHRPWSHLHAPQTNQPLTRLGRSTRRHQGSRVSFTHYDLGYIDLEQKILQPLDNPFGTRLLPMS